MALRATVRVLDRAPFRLLLLAHESLCLLFGAEGGLESAALEGPPVGGDLGDFPRSRAAVGHSGLRNVAHDKEWQRRWDSNPRPPFIKRPDSPIGTERAGALP